MIFKLVNPVSREVAVRAIRDAPKGWVCRLTDATRSLDQNAKLWPMLTDISQQVEWYGKMLTPEEWKDVFTAAINERKVVPGLDGGFVVCGQSSSALGKEKFSVLLDLIQAFGDERSVKWSEHEHI